MDDEATSEGPGRQGRQRWADELAAARNALEEARRQAARSALGTEEPTDPRRSLPLNKEQGHQNDKCQRDHQTPQLRV